MNEQEVRALVREAIERHLRRSLEPTMADGQSTMDDGRSPIAVHPSHVLLRVLPGSDLDDGMCVIEPAVRCNHCGFCQSHGH